MNYLKKTVLAFCFMTSQVALPMQGKLLALTSSIKKTALISGTIAYTHAVVTGPQDFTKLPNIKTYRKQWRETIDNTAQSLKLVDKISTPIDTNDKKFDASDTPN